jgi:hypothetical protein
MIPVLSYIASLPRSVSRSVPKTPHPTKGLKENNLTEILHFVQESQSLETLQSLSTFYSCDVFYEYYHISHIYVNPLYGTTV